MILKTPARVILAATGALAMLAANPAEARNCSKRISKTGGAVIGAVGGAVLGNVIAGGTTGTVLGAAAGGIAGHEIARKNRRNCRYYRR
ncbi:glycine zipper 2TM domain-containing protein [Novosphingobium sp. KCTC 2891]|uniref:glycine zipper 2TM domain-containing protein n=1 Tax=Novosphingobium sp. KCTC 2891 TaxID=2989730 RepID=UPI0029CA456C|nr:glycine zipper 2TM domain-containing protein [Novosphingobium sp. KCTC 2891]